MRKTVSVALVLLMFANPATAWSTIDAQSGDSSLATPAKSELEPEIDQGARRSTAHWLRVAADLEPQDSLRLKLWSSAEYEGQFISSTDSTLSLVIERRETVIPVVDIAKLWARGRATGTGAKIGAITGVIGGAVLGLLAGMISGMEGGTEINPGAGALMGGLAGGATLGLLGAGIGAATPKWHLKYEAVPGDLPELQTASVAPQVKEETATIETRKVPGTGGLRIMGGYAVSISSGEPPGGLGGMLDYLAQVKPNLSLGPEIGYSWLGEGTGYFHLGATAILSPIKWNDQFYLVGGIDVYDWSGSSGGEMGVGFSLGGGRRFRSRSGRSSLDLEVRWHSNLRIASDTRVITAMVGYQRSW